MPCSIKKSENVIIKNTLLALEHSEYFLACMKSNQVFFIFVIPYFGM